ncbi:glucose dehydrogenase [FAD, quinone]-like [Photinus pyralis]|nr:glucose dehydrogenase [FAD, quinone]-like [Photinus pyralis]
MVIPPLLLCVTLFHWISAADNLTVNYYTKLISSEVSRAFTFELPTDSTTFETDSRVWHGGFYDYIVVGAGYAGSVIAARLSENPSNSVLLLEAGGFESNFSDIPRMSEYLRGLEYNWNFQTTQQTSSCLGMVDGKCNLPSGRGIGGSSILNDLSYERGNKADYDSWCGEGLSGWCYDDVLPLFKKSENFKVPDGDDDYHDTEGLLNVEPVKLCNRQLDAFIAANVELGREEVDYNGAQQLGVSRMQKNTINGTRQSIAKAFLSDTLNRTNLKVYNGSLVTQITTFLWKATGVRYSRGGRFYRARALREVILAAGAIGSAQLLMLSGIGSKNNLRTVRNLPVGENLQDHPAYLALHFVTDFTEPIVPIEDNVRDYLDGFGRYTVGGNTQGLAFIKVNQSNPSEQPDIQLVLLPSNNSNGFEQRAYNYNDETYGAIWEKLDPRRSFTIRVVLLHPKSRGTIKLQSTSPYIYPAIDPKFFSDENGEDIETMYQGILAAIELANTTAFKNMNAVLFDATVPQCSVHDRNSREYWYCQIRHLAVPLGHMVGTCKMGLRGSGAVVNYDLRVHGMKRLRVADSSVIPNIVSADPSIASIMIGEKVSELIMG